MSVVDASVFVDALVVAGQAGDSARQELRAVDVLEVPTIFGAEVCAALRALVARKQLATGRATSALRLIRTVRANRYPFEPFAHRAWQLRANLTVYDAWYVALAEWLGTDLVTADDGLVSAPGPRCRVRRPAEG